PFDATACLRASVADLDSERMRWFVREARRARGFPLREEVTPNELLTHLNLLDDGRPTNAAMLLFGREPQRFLLASELKCAHFHGTEVAKPIPSYQVYKGTVFALVDQAVDFVMSKIALRVGTRAEGPQVPVSYEIPREVVAEAIVNAVAHRDYTSHGSVQVMLFADRLEVWNPGRLPQSLTLAMLREPHGSVPANPLLAEPLYLAKYIERMGTGTRDMIRRCREAGLPEPEFSERDGFVTTIGRAAAENVRVIGGAIPHVTPYVTPHVAPHVAVLVRLLGAAGDLSSADLARNLGLRDRKHLRERYLAPCLEERLIEMTIPDRPKSRDQRYRLTATGRQLLATLNGDEGTAS
ncbi:MAG: Fic family protein, partial [Thermoanaerobaculia bacterium]